MIMSLFLGLLFICAKTLISSHPVKKGPVPWPVLLSRLERRPVNRKVMGLIHSQGTYVGVRFDPQSGRTREATN